MNKKKIEIPNSIESEMMVLGSMLTNINSLNAACNELVKSDFYYTEHQIIFEVILELYKKDKPADIHIVSEELKRLEKLNDVGGISYLTTLAQYVGTSAYIEEYVKLVKEKSILRTMIDTAQAIEKSAIEEAEDVFSLLDISCRKLLKISHTTSLSINEKPIVLKSISEISTDYFKEKPQPKPMLLYYCNDNKVKEAFLHKEIVAMLVGEGGRGKTHLLALLAMCVASGIPFLDVFHIEKPGAVCFIAGENNQEDIKRLLWKIQKYLEEVLNKNRQGADGNDFFLHNQDPLEEIEKNLIPVSTHGLNSSFIDKNGNATSFYNNLLFQLKEKEAELERAFQLIILDPVSRFSGLEAEKDNPAATSFISHLERISDELKLKPTILFAHHKSKSAINENKPSQTHARGSSGFTDGVRWQGDLSIGNEELHTIFKVTKTNFTAYHRNIVISKNRDGIPEFEKWGENQSAPKASKNNKQSTKDDDILSYDISKFKKTT